MLPSPEGVWGMPKNLLVTLPGYDPDLNKNRLQARAIMQKLGYSPEKRLKVKIATRNIPVYRDPAVILIDQLKEIYIDAEMEVVETSIWHAKVTRKEYQVGLNLTGNGVDDPDQNFYENYKCGSERNYTGYCNPELDKLFDDHMRERDVEKRKALIRAFEKRLFEQAYQQPLLWWHRIVPTHKTLMGWKMSPSHNLGAQLEDVWLNA